MDPSKDDLDSLLAGMKGPPGKSPEGRPKGPPSPEGRPKGPPEAPGAPKATEKKEEKKEEGMGGNAGWIVAVIVIVVMMQGNSIWANLNTSALARGVQQQAGQIGQINAQFQSMGEAYNNQAGQIVQMSGALSQLTMGQKQMQTDIQMLTSGMNSLNASVQSLQAQTGSQAPAGYAQPVQPQYTQPAQVVQPVPLGLPPLPNQVQTVQAVGGGEPIVDFVMPNGQIVPQTPQGQAYQCGDRMCDPMGNPLPNGEPIIEFLGRELGNLTAPQQGGGGIDLFNVSYGTY